MWMPCVPGGSWVTSTSMRTPPADGENVAVPIFWPVALTMSACADCAICADDFCGVAGVFSRGGVCANADGSTIVEVHKTTARIAVRNFMGLTSVDGAGSIPL